MNHSNVSNDTESKNVTRFEQFLTNKYIIVLFSFIFGLSYIFQRFFTDLDEYFISNVLRNHFTKEFLDPFWLAIFWLTVAIFFMMILCFFVFINKRRDALAMLAIVVIGGLFLGDALKIVFQLDRPPGHFSDWVPAIYNSFIPLPGESHDFPAQSVLVPAALFTYFYLKKPERKRAISYLIFTGVLFFARPYIGVNHISASVAGTILGMYIGLIVHRYLDQVRSSALFDSKIKKLLISVGIFALMTFIYTLERPLFYSEPSRGVDLDIRMFSMVLGGFIGISVDGPKQLQYRFETSMQKLKFIISLLIAYLVLFTFYVSALLVPIPFLFIGIVIGFIDGLWISIGGPKFVEYMNKTTIKNSKEEYKNGN